MFFKLEELYWLDLRQSKYYRALTLLFFLKYRKPHEKSFEVVKLKNKANKQIKSLFLNIKFDVH